MIHRERIDKEHLGHIEVVTIEGTTEDLIKDIVEEDILEEDIVEEAIVEKDIVEMERGIMKPIMTHRVAKEVAMEAREGIEAAMTQIEDEDRIEAEEIETLEDVGLERI